MNSLVCTCLLLLVLAPLDTYQTPPLQYTRKPYGKVQQNQERIKTYRLAHSPPHGDEQSVINYRRKPGTLVISNNGEAQSRSEVTDLGSSQENNLFFELKATVAECERLINSRRRGQGSIKSHDHETALVAAATPSVDPTTIPHAKASRTNRELSRKSDRSSNGDEEMKNPHSIVVPIPPSSIRGNAAAKSTGTTPSEKLIKLLSMMDLTLSKKSTDQPINNKAKIINSWVDGVRLLNNAFIRALAREFYSANSEAKRAHANLLDSINLQNTFGLDCTEDLAKHATLPALLNKLAANQKEFNSLDELDSDTILQAVLALKSWRLGLLKHDEENKSKPATSNNWQKLLQLGSIKMLNVESVANAIRMESFMLESVIEKRPIFFNPSREVQKLMDDARQLTDAGVEKKEIVKKLEGSPTIQKELEKLNQVYRRFKGKVHLIEKEIEKKKNKDKNRPPPTYFEGVASTPVQDTQND